MAAFAVKMEEVDVNVLTRPEEFILKDGGVILMAYWNDEIAGTVALRKMKSGDYELTKMAVDEKFRGKGIGEALIHGLIDRAKEMGLKRVILYSNTVLENAIRLYRRLGFKEITLEKGLYERSDIKMEIEIEPATVI
jgi:ribosomal protein S18 acetylase RimI-like enzyme